MEGQNNIEFLKEKIVLLENENRQFKSMLVKQVDFGNKMTEMIAEMDELLESKKSKIESLTQQLATKMEDIDHGPRPSSETCWIFRTSKTSQNKNRTFEK